MPLHPQTYSILFLFVLEYIEIILINGNDNDYMIHNVHKLNKTYITYFKQVYTLIIYLFVDCTYIYTHVNNYLQYHTYISLPSIHNLTQPFSRLHCNVDEL